MTTSPRGGGGGGGGTAVLAGTPPTAGHRGQGPHGGGGGGGSSRSGGGGGSVIKHRTTFSSGAMEATAADGGRGRGQTWAGGKAGGQEDQSAIEAREAAEAGAGLVKVYSFVCWGGGGVDE